MTIGILMTALGLLMNFWANRRVFRRRNEYGVEQFSSYSASLIAVGVERAVLILGRLLTFAGLVVVGLHWLFHL